MKTVCAIFLLSQMLCAQGLTIGSGTTFSLGSSTLSLIYHWNNSGTFDAGSGTVIFVGPGGDQTITNASGETFYNLTVNKANGNLQLLNNITVNGTLTLISGDLDMNGKAITLGSAALVSESTGNTVKGYGSISGTVSLNAPSSENPFGLGAIITSAADLGSTTVTRRHIEHSSNGNTSILRSYTISPASNTGLDATLVFSYDESELNGKTESDLGLYKSTDGGTTWTTEYGTVNTETNTVTLSGINDFSRWTLGGSSEPLPMELVELNIEYRTPNVELQWRTATEVNNAGWEVQRSEVREQRTEVRNQESENGRKNEWEKSGFVAGNGTTNASKEYSFTDKVTKAGKYSYRLKQIDRDGKFSYSQEVEVNVDEAPKVFVLEQNYPNPFNPTTTIGFTLVKSGMTTLKIYDAIGREVATLVNEPLEAGVYHQKQFDAGNLASGIYFMRLQCGDDTQLKKMLLLK